MPLFPDLADMALRILLTVVAGAAIGFERGESGKAAGVRTTVLVGLAACLAMIQANLLLPTNGKTSASFATMDVMRLPLGILTGVGFIGAGAILRRNDLVIGLTTAATLWFMTMLGLAFGGGQIWLGLAGTVLGLGTIWGMRFVEPHLPRDRQACLTIRYDRGRVAAETLLADAVQAPYALQRSNSSLSPLMGTGEIRLYLRWRGIGPQNMPPEIVETLARREGVQHVSWDPAGMPADW